MAVGELEAAFEARVRDLAGQYARGDLSLTDWHTKMAGSVRLYLTMEHLDGTNGARVGLVRINQEVRRQHAYLSRFADELAVRQLQGRPMTEAQLANRAALYAGAGRAVRQRATESVGPTDVRYRYEALDDNGTCSPCLAAEGVYPASAGPYPGEVCLGRGRCRCKRVRIEDRAA